MKSFLPFILFVIVVGLAAVPLLEGKDPARLPSALIGKVVPATTLPAAIGSKGFATADFKKPAVVNFFASYCVTCRAEQKVLEKLVKENKVTLYGIDYKDTKPAVRDWLARYGNPFAAVGFDADGRAAIDWGVYGVPETFLVDKNGVIRRKFVGALTMELYKKEVKATLEELK